MKSPSQVLKLCFKGELSQKTIFFRTWKKQPPKFFCEKSILRNFDKFTGKHRGGSRIAATSKMERFVIIVNGWKPLTIITNRSILDVAAVLDPPLKHLWQSLFFNKVAGLRSETLLKKRLWHRCFPVKFAKSLRKRFLQNTSGRLLLHKMHFHFPLNVKVKL